MQAGLVTLNEIRPATYIGKGKVDEIAGLVKSRRLGIVVMDCALSPVQQRNLEKAWSAKVLDRTGLILEIFGRRARTREGALQVELAHLTYQKSRLVRSWTHLERQRGGFGFLGGPGETQIEADRRVIEERIARIEAELEKVKRTRKLHRDSRKRVPYPIVALVGYTNAGKSTLFNRLTAASVLSADMLFATLDPTLRAVELPRGHQGDPVRHRRLHLRSADHAGGGVPRDAGRGDRGRRHPARARRVARGRRGAVARRRGGAGRARHRGRRQSALIEVWNKIDRLDAEARARVLNLAERQPADRRPVLVSALTGEGIDAPLDRDRGAAGREPADARSVGRSGRRRGRELAAPPHRGARRKTLADDGRLAVTVRADADKAARVRAKFEIR